MIRTAFLPVLALLGLAACEAPPPPPDLAIANPWGSYCIGVRNGAAALMRERQAGTLRAQAMNTRITGSASWDAQLLGETYATPVFSTYQEQGAAIQAFANRTEASCYQRT